MIHEIVSSDVDFARGMMGTGHPDTEILAYLASRGLEPAKAAQLVDDLRHGRKPDTHLPFELQPTGQRVAGARELAKGEAREAQHAHRRRAGKGRQGGAGVPWWFLILAGIALAALGYVLFQTGNSLTGDAISNSKHELPAAPGK